MKQKSLTITDFPEQTPPDTHLDNLMKNELQKPTEPSKLEEIVLTENAKKGEFPKFSLKKGQKITIGVFVLLAILAVPGYFIAQVLFFAPQSTGSIINLSKPYFEARAVTNSKTPTLTLALPSEPRTSENPINGELMTKTDYDKYMKKLPVAVMTNNHSAARPQSSLTRADIVFEAIAESGITRYMPVYWSEMPNKVGPIRSARQYYLEWLSPYDAIYIHDGCAASKDPRVNACGNIKTYKINDLGVTGAWREYDGVRFAPHNEYSSAVKAQTLAKEQGWVDFPTDFKPWEFKRDAIKAERGKIKEVNVKFSQAINNGGAYDVKWVYKSSSNTFDRFIAGVKDIDQENNKQVSSKTVILQNIKLTHTGDDKGHLIQQLIGEGTATILSDGKSSKVTWKKASRTAQTRYFNSDGTEFQFNRGQIWVMAIPIGDGKSAIIENK